MSLREAYESLEAHLQHDPEGALRGLVPIAKALPEFAPARLRVVDALIALDQKEAAVSLLEEFAESFAHKGQPMQAILCAKLLETLGEDAEATAAEIALLYAGLTGYELVPQGAPQVVPEIAVPPPLSVGGSDLVAEAAALAKHDSPLPDRFPAMPLFSRLTVEDFVVVLRALKLYRVDEGTRLIAEGKAGTSCFLLADGTLGVSRRIGGVDKPLAKLYPGTIFGEMALVSRRPRSASITSLTKAAILELDKGTLLEHGTAMKDALYAFSRRRMLENITVTSPIFRPLNKDDRLALIGIFGSFPLQPGVPVIKQGEDGQGVYVVLRGAVRVTKHVDGQDVELATLCEGDLFGEISVLGDTKTTATVTPTEPGEVLFLDKAEFRAVAARHPEVQKALASLSLERLHASDAIIEQATGEYAVTLI